MQSTWKRLTEGGTTYFMKRNIGENSLKVVITDLIYVWVRKYTIDEVRCICEELNPLIEFDEEVIVKKVWPLFDEIVQNQDNSKSSSVEVTVLGDESLQLKIRTEIDGVAFKFALNAVKESPLVFFKEVTQSIVSSAEELLFRQDLLCSLLEKKDDEISQYKLEGASLSRRNVETQYFVRADFVSKSHLKEHVSGLSEELMNVIGIIHPKSDSTSQPSNDEQHSNTVEILPSNKTIKNSVETGRFSDCSKIDIQSDTEPNPFLEGKQLENGAKHSVKVSKPKKPKLNL